MSCFFLSGAGNDVILDGESFKAERSTLDVTGNELRALFVLEGVT